MSDFVIPKTYIKGGFKRELLNNRSAKDENFTHTSLGNPLGKFYIPENSHNQFYNYYVTALKKGEKFHLTEKHNKTGPFIIDIDLRFESKPNFERKYTLDNIKDFMKIYFEYIYKYVNITKEEQRHTFIMEKSKPIEEKGLIKDGLHIEIPFLSTKPTIQHYIRKKIIEDPRVIEIFKDKIGSTNDISDIIDESIIEKNNWFMYGSSKPEKESYKVTHIYSYQENLENIEILEEEHPDYFDEYKLVPILSISNKKFEIPTKEECVSEVENFIQDKNTFKKVVIGEEQRKMALIEYINKVNNTETFYQNLTLVKDLLNILDVKRAEKYDDWIRLGWCLRNIDSRLLNDWIEFSKKSPKFEEGACDKLWNNMRFGDLSIGTLKYWAKIDNEVEYEKIIEKSVRDIIDKKIGYIDEKNIQCSPTAIAEMMYMWYGNKYMSVDIKKEIWYEFKNHKWGKVDSAYTLRDKLSGDDGRIRSIFLKYRADIFDEVNSISSELNKIEYLKCDKKNSNVNYMEKEIELKSKKSTLMKRVELMNIVANKKLEETSFKENIMKECRYFFKVDNFEEKLDSNTHLIGFNNGVYDLNFGEFRDGQPEDYISLSTNIDYIPFDSDELRFDGVDDFLAKVFPNKALREYVLYFLASCLDGEIRQEKFHFWLGEGSNGKSKLIELFELGMGEYCIKFPVTLVTRQRGAAGSANPEVAKSKGKRFAVLQEPSEDEKINVGLLKELTGGDKIQARALYSEPVEFKPQFHMVLCCNHLPEVPANDNGTWRRIRVCKFMAKFTDKPDPQEPYEFKADEELSQKLIEWKEAFISKLIEIYKLYRIHGMHEPEEVKCETDEYRATNDIYAEFINDSIEKDQESVVMEEELMMNFRGWWKINFPQSKFPKRKAIRDYFDKKYGKKGLSRKSGWKGIRLVEDNEQIDEDDE